MTSTHYAADPTPTGALVHAMDERGRVVVEIPRDVLPMVQEACEAGRIADPRQQWMEFGR